MAETRVQVAYHFKIDPAQLTPGRVQLPEMITRTIAVGDAVIPEKVASAALSPADRAALLVEIENQVREATRTARPDGEPVADPAPVEDEERAF